MFNTEDEILRRLQEKNLEMAVMFYHWCQRNHLTCCLLYTSPSPRDCS